MLRWVRSTVRGYDRISNARLHSTAYSCLPRHVDGPRWHRPPIPNFQLEASITKSEGPAVHLESAHEVGSRVREPCTYRTHSSNELRVTDIPATSGGGPTQKRDSCALLRDFLAGEDSSASTSQKQTPGSLKALYRAAKSSSQLSTLSSGHFSALISLLGSISLPMPKTAFVYSSKLLSRVEESSDRTYWPIVIEMARDKEELGRRLSDSDRYWIMRARLGSLAVAEQGQHDSVNKAAIDAAAVQYLHICRRTSDAEVHIPFIERLVSVGTPSRHAQAATALCRVFAKFENLDLRFLDLLWRVTLSVHVSASTQIRQRILSTMWLRLAKSGPGERHSSGSRRHTFDPVLKRHTPIPPDVPLLISALTSSICPTHGVPFPTQKWAIEEFKAALDPEKPLEVRWSNFALLALHHAPTMLAHPSDVSTAYEDHIDATLPDWRTLLILGTLEKLVVDGETLSDSRKDDISTVARPLWRSWKAAPRGDRSSLASRTIVAAFFRLAGSIRDGPLLEGLYRYSLASSLWVSGEESTVAERFQIRGLALDYAIAVVECKGAYWTDILDALSVVSSEPQWRTHCMETIISHFIPRDIDTVFQLYHLCRGNRISLSTEATHGISVALASSRVHLAIPFLRDSTFSEKQLEQLLAAVLLCLQQQRYQFLDSKLGITVAETMENMYTRKLPTKSALKYPVRYSIYLLSASGQYHQMVPVVEHIYRAKPTFFTVRYILRLIRLLIRHRRFVLTVRLLRLMKKAPATASDNVRRKVAYGLAEGGAHRLASKVDYTARFPRWRNARETMGRKIQWRATNPPRNMAIQVLPLLDTKNVASIKYAFNILIKAKRPVAARKLFERSHKHLDTATRTSLGNTFLHRVLDSFGTRNGQLVRKMLGTRKFLIKKFSFVEDRVTVNIIVKGLLHWSNAYDSSKIKTLFDNLIRQGYPASAYYRQVNDVPFGTPMPSSPQAFSASHLPPHISFKRHTRPLYKMFIKALHLRGDHHAANIVVGVLQAEGAMALRHSQDISRSRMLGIHKAKNAVNDECL